jgi:uncharacterized protein (TIGR02117 family)
LKSLFKTLIIFCFISTNYALEAEPLQDDSVSVYLVKLGWHTGMVIRTEDVDSSYLPQKRLFNQFKYVDIGWGDDEFYRTPGFDIGLAIKALFYPTVSTLRIEGFNFDIMKYIGYSDVGYMIRLDRNSFNKLSRYISSAFYVNDSSNVELLESRYNGHISFYRATGKYTVFNTCNTWVSKGFKSAGYDIKTKIVLSEELFDEIDQLSSSVKLK